MAVGNRAGKKQGKDRDKGTRRGGAGVEKALARARAQLDKRRRQVEEALALVASLEVRSIQHGDGPTTARTRRPAARATTPAQASSSASKAASSRSSKPAPAKAASKPAATKPAAARASAKPATPATRSAPARATTKAKAAAASVGAGARRKSVKPPSAG